MQSTERVTRRFACRAPSEALTVKVWEDAPGSSIFQTLGGDGRVVIDAGRVTHT